VSVTFLNDGTEVCNSTGAFALVEFTTELGDLPLMTSTVTNLGGGTVTVTEHQKGIQMCVYAIVVRFAGTKTDLECSAQGICDEETGVCGCMEGYTSSDGSFDAPGERGDCAYLNPYYGTA